MKRQALGKGLGALIPDKGGVDPLAVVGPGSVGMPTMGEHEMSAADIRSALGTREIPAAAQPVTSTPPSGSTHAHGPMPQGTAASGSGSLQWVDIDRIRPNPRQPRKNFGEEAIEELAASIRSSGILQPVIVRKVDGVYNLIAGERRWRAAQRAGLHRIPALIREVPEERVLELALIENLQREALNPMEEARAYSSLMEDFGLTQAEVGERVGRQRSTIANSLRLLDLSPRVQTLVEAGALTMGHARALVSLPSPKAQEFGANQIISRGLSVREAELWVSRHTEDPAEPRPAPHRDPNVSAAETQLQKRLGTRIRILPGRGEKGRILIEYYSAAELDRLYDRLIKS